VTREELDRLRELAAKATAGPWLFETVRTSSGVCHKIGPFPSRSTFDDKPRHACLYSNYPSDSNPNDRELLANAQWIAAANPSTITAMIDHISRLERDARAGRELREGMKSLTGKHVTAANIRLGLNMLCDAYDDTATESKHD
jgi:hypothetical protein